MVEVEVTVMLRVVGDREGSARVSGALAVALKPLESILPTPGSIVTVAFGV